MRNQEMVEEFHRAMGITLNMSPTANLLPSEVGLRIKLVLEEASEYVEAAVQGDLVQVAHELADLLYVVYGTAATYGIDLDPVFARIHKANMQKLDHLGRPAYREDGKIVKPEGWKPADTHYEIIDQQVRARLGESR